MSFIEELDTVLKYLVYDPQSIVTSLKTHYEIPCGVKFSYYQSFVNIRNVHAKKDS